MMSGEKRVGVIGEAMGELFARSTHQMTVGIGGDTFNAAVYLAQMEGAPEADYFSAIGDDPFSRLMHEQCVEYGVGTGSLYTDTNRSIGLYSITNDADGERHFNYWRSDSAARHYLSHLTDAGVMKDLMSCDALYFSGITLAVMTPESRQAFLQALSGYTRGKIYFDDNYRPGLWGDDAATWYEAAIQAADCLLLSVDDQLQLHQLSAKDQLIERLSVYGGKTFVLRDGHRPMTILLGQDVHEIEVNAVTPVDTTAAGDSFTGTFIALTEMGYNLLDAAAHAARVSAFVIQQAGALVKLPTALRCTSE